MAVRKCAMVCTVCCLLHVGGATRVLDTLHQEGEWMDGWMVLLDGERGKNE